MTLSSREHPGPIVVGVSGCLLGHKVRYDGSDKLQPCIEEVLGQYFRLAAFCPEVAIGLGVPRPPIQLRREASAGGAIRCVSLDGSRDYTAALSACADEQSSLTPQISGYILKRSSPSCGIDNVKVHDQGRVERSGRGIFAQRLMSNLPGLPVEDEERLEDAELRNDFIRRVHAYWQRQQLPAS